MLFFSFYNEELLWTFVEARVAHEGTSKMIDKLYGGSRLVSVDQQLGKLAQLSTQTVNLVNPFGYLVNPFDTECTSCIFPATIKSLTPPMMFSCIVN